MRRFLETVSLFVGLSAILIGSAIAVFGVAPVGDVFTGALQLVYAADPMTGLGHANTDSELRFYSVFFVAFGFLLCRSARDFEGFGAQMPWLFALFFAGGCARLLSYFMAGPPHSLFVLLMAIELILPPIMWLAYWRDRKTASGAIAI